MMQVKWYRNILNPISFNEIFVLLVLNIYNLSFITSFNDPGQEKALTEDDWMTWVHFFVWFHFLPLCVSFVYTHRFCRSWNTAHRWTGGRWVCSCMRWWQASHHLRLIMRMTCLSPFSMMTCCIQCGSAKRQLASSRRWAANAAVISVHKLYFCFYFCSSTHSVLMSDWLEGLDEFFITAWLSANCKANHRFI